MILEFVVPRSVINAEPKAPLFLTDWKELDPYKALSAPGLNPAVPVAVDFSNRAATPLLCRASYSIPRRKK
jgi:hypothetical protein